MMVFLRGTQVLPIKPSNLSLLRRQGMGVLWLKSTLKMLFV